MHMQAVILLLLGVTSASPTHLLEERQTNCPEIHVFGARETTVSQGYGTAGVVVKLILGAYPGATSEAIVYPACGGQASCGGISYASSVLEGTEAVTSAINVFNTRCPNTQLVLVGYSQGAQVMDNAFCGGDTGSGLPHTLIPIQASAISQIKAAIWMGDPRFRSGFSFDVGTCTTHGFSPRPVGFVCPFAAKVQSYCDAADPYCCTGSDQATHQGYGAKYGPVSLAFVKTKLSTSGGGNTNAAIPALNSMGPVSRNVHRYGQCGGTGWTGSSVCAAGLTCTAANAYYSLCL